MTIALRPLSTAELLDRTFHLYRNNFMLFAGIAALPAGFQLVMGLLQIIMQKSLMNRSTNPGVMIAAGLLMFVLAMVLFIGSVAAAVMSSGATVYAVSMVHLERPTSITQSYKSVFGVFWNLLGFTLLVGVLTVAVLFVLGIPVIAVYLTAGPSTAFFLTAGIAVIAALAVFLYFLARFGLGTPACVLEKLSPIAAMSRSGVLTRGHRWRIVLVIVLAVVVTYVLDFLLVLPPTLLLLTNKGAPPLPILLWNQFAQFVATTIGAPILSVALVLAYYDERVRKEAFDLQLMMDSLAQPRPDQPPAAAPTFG